MAKQARVAVPVFTAKLVGDQFELSCATDKKLQRRTKKAAQEPLVAAVVLLRYSEYQD